MGCHHLFLRQVKALFASIYAIIIYLCIVDAPNTVNCVTIVTTNGTAIFDLETL